MGTVTDMSSLSTAWVVTTCIVHHYFSWVLSLSPLIVAVIISVIYIFLIIATLCFNYKVVPVSAHKVHPFLLISSPLGRGGGWEVGEKPRVLNCQPGKAVTIMRSGKED